MKRKGFTLIELIVVMSIIGVLTLLGLPKYKSHVEDARLTRLLVQVKELEKACQKYYMVHDDWPRLNDAAFTSEQINTFTEKVYNRTSKVIELEPSGKYYEIGYEKISKYIKAPNDNIHYILQNPVGDVFYMHNLTDEGKSNLNKEVVVTPQPNYAKPISFKGLSNLAFDTDLNTSHIGAGVVTWEGNLDNREITIVSEGNLASFVKYPLHIIFRDKNNNLLIPVGEISSTVLLSPDGTKTTKKTIVPEGAVQMEFKSSYMNGSLCKIYEISINSSYERPIEVKNISSESTTSSITLTWEQEDLSYSKAAVLRDGVFIGYTSTKVYVDKPLNANQDYRYSIIAINSYGNASKKVIYDTQTIKPEIIFNGLSASVYDSDLNTSHVGSGIVTWEGSLENKEITIVSEGNMASFVKHPLYVRFKNKENNLLTPIGETSSNVLLSPGSTKTTKKIIVPDGAVQMEFYSGYMSGSLCKIYEISVSSK